MLWVSLSVSVEGFNIGCSIRMYCCARKTQEMLRQHQIYLVLFLSKIAFCDSYNYYTCECACSVWRPHSTSKKWHRNTHIWLLIFLYPTYGYMKYYVYTTEVFSIFLLYKIDVGNIEILVCNKLLNRTEYSLINKLQRTSHIVRSDNSRYIYMPTRATLIGNQKKITDHASGNDMWVFMES